MMVARDAEIDFVVNRYLRLEGMIVVELEKILSRATCSFVNTCAWLLIHGEAYLACCCTWHLFRMETQKPRN